MKQRKKKPARRQHRIFQVRSPLGAQPGVVKSHPDALGTELRIISYDQNKIEEKWIDDPAVVSNYRREGGVLWVDVTGLGDPDVIKHLGRQFGLHGLALEDVVNVHQRPKVELYDRYIFLTIHMMTTALPLETEQVSCFLGQDYLLTFQEKKGDCFEPSRQRLREQLGPLRKRGPDFLLYALVDSIVDHYFPHAEQYARLVEELENTVLFETNSAVLKTIHEMRTQASHFHRFVRGQSDATAILLRNPGERFAEATVPYLRDCHDHLLQLLEFAESNREMSRSLLELYLSINSHRSNEVMRFLTVVATIFIPLTFLVGVYGMNFDPAVSPWNMPEVKWPYGYPALLLLMLGVAAGLLFYFRKNGWIGTPRPTPSSQQPGLKSAPTPSEPASGAQGRAGP